jgi:hypothetical protein
MRAARPEVARAVVRTTARLLFGRMARSTGLRSIEGAAIPK